MCAMYIGKYVKAVAGAKGFFHIDITKKSDAQPLNPLISTFLSSRLVMVEIFQKTKNPNTYLLGPITTT